MELQGNKWSSPKKSWTWNSMNTNNLENTNPEDSHPDPCDIRNDISLYFFIALYGVSFIVIAIVYARDTYNEKKK